MIRYLIPHRLYLHLEAAKKAVAKDYYQDKSFCRSESGEIDLWKCYNLFTGATKSSYIDTFIDRNVGSLLFINSLVEHLRDRTKSWFLI